MILLNLKPSLVSSQLNKTFNVTTFNIQLEERRLTR